ncbi:unnamed protein product, partial [Polarella glacialis]
AGRDAYLCAEYNWDGEYYVQDFGPQHVRKLGEKKTVMQLLSQAAPMATGELESTKVVRKDGNRDLDDTKVVKKNAEQDLDDTKVYEGHKRAGNGRDTGGGLSSFLED